MTTKKAIKVMKPQMPLLLKRPTNLRGHLTQISKPTQLANTSTRRMTAVPPPRVVHQLRTTKEMNISPCWTKWRNQINRLIFQSKEWLKMWRKDHLDGLCYQWPVVFCWALITVTIFLEQLKLDLRLIMILHHSSMPFYILFIPIQIAFFHYSVEFY